MTAKQVLIIENDATLQQLLESTLVARGYDVCRADDGEQGLREFAQRPFDLLLLDIMLPKTSGWEVLRQIRRRAQIPVLVISALSREEYITHAAQYGADFLVKPFSRAALLAAVEAMLAAPAQSAHQAKGQQHPDEQPLPVALYADQPNAAFARANREQISASAMAAHLQIDLATRRVMVAGKRVKLTGTEYRLLEHLVNHAGQVLTYQQLLEAVWGWEYRDSTHYVHVFISQLRQKLESDPNDPRYLLTERGVGYCFVWSRET